MKLSIDRFLSLIRWGTLVAFSYIVLHREGPDWFTDLLLVGTIIFFGWMFDDMERRYLRMENIADRAVKLSEKLSKRMENITDRAVKLSEKLSNLGVKE
jgi:hypothetical protein